MSETKLESLRVFNKIPKPILKNNLSTRNHAPVFFSGNEIYPYDSEQRDEEIKLDSIVHLDNFTHTMHQKSIFLTNEEDRFRKSHLTHSKPNSDKPRALSAFYIFHSLEINRQIIKTFLKSTDGFIEKFKKSLLAEKLSDQEFYRNFKNKLVYGLREFLLNKDTLFEEYTQSNQIGATLSEPCIMELQNYRIKYKQEQFVHQSKSDSNIEKAFITANVDIYGKQNENLIDQISASLHNSSFLKAYTKEKKSRQNKNILSKANTAKKIVRFADSFGLELENVKIITNNSFVEAFSQDIDERVEDMNFDKLLNIYSNPFIVLIPLFSVRKTIDMNVQFDDYHFDYQNRIIKCIVKVKNICYKKRVFARITFNNWKNCYDLDAIYTKSESLSYKSILRSNEAKQKLSFLYDYFGFCIILPEKQSDFEENKLRIEFALCFETGQTSFWDNNLGENYKFKCFYNTSH